MYATTKELKKKQVTLKIENTKERVFIQVTSHLEINLQKIHL